MIGTKGEFATGVGVRSNSKSSLGLKFKYDIVSHDVG